MPRFTNITDTIDAISGLRNWWTCRDQSTVTLTYTVDEMASATAAGTSGTSTITTSSDLSAVLVVGNRIRLGSAGSVTAVSTLGADTYTITAISTTTLTVTPALTSTYTTSAIYRGYVSQWNDKASSPINLTQGTANRRPHWVDNHKNGIGGVKATIDTVTAGNSDFLSSTTTISAVTAETVFVVCRTATPFPTSSGGGPLMASAAGGSAQNYRLTLVNASSENRMEMATVGATDGSQALRSIQQSNTNTTIIAMRRSVALNQIQLWENGGIRGYNNHTSGSVDVRPQLFRDGFAVNHSNSYISEVVCYNSYLSNADMQRAFAILNNKYDIFRNVSWFTQTDRNNPFYRAYAYANSFTESSSPTRVNFVVSVGDSIAAGTQDTFASVVLPVSPYWGDGGGSSPFTLAGNLIYNDGFSFDILTAQLSSGLRQSALVGGVYGFGQELSLTKDIQVSTGLDTYILKYAIGGTSQGLGWLANSGAQALEFQRRLIRCLRKLCYVDGKAIDTLVINYSLGANDASTGAGDITTGNYPTFGVNFVQNATDFINWVRTLPGMNPDTKVVMHIANSNSSSRLGIPNIKQFTLDVAAAMDEVYITDLILDVATDTVQGVHPTVAKSIAQGQAAAAVALA